MQLRRLTFHEFMLHEVHGRLFRYQHIADPLAAVADRLMRDMRVLCLDEFFVTDVADATILARLFGYLWDRGLVVVATSNRRVLAHLHLQRAREMFGRAAAAVPHHQPHCWCVDGSTTQQAKQGDVHVGL